MASDAQELSPGGGRAGAPGGVPGADYRFSVERAILLDTHTGLRLDCLLRVSWRNPWLPPPTPGRCSARRMTGATNIRSSRTARFSPGVTCTEGRFRAPPPPCALL
ncbi:hypothetical protein M5E87_27970 [Flavonifractor plautii]|nr:hypothetical protein M5E87_27970 [Flavonifractor plautii]